MIKERIEINEQSKRYGEIMQQSHAAATGGKQMSKEQAEAAKIFMVGFKTVIGRFVPDLKAVEHSGHIERNDISDAPLTDDEWSNKYSNLN